MQRGGISAAFLHGLISEKHIFFISYIFHELESRTQLSILLRIGNRSGRKAVSWQPCEKTSYKLKSNKKIVNRFTK